MRKFAVLILAFALTSFTSQLGALAQDMSPQVKKIIEEARQDCKSFEDGELTLGDNVFNQIDVTGDGKPDEIFADA